MCDVGTGRARAAAALARAARLTVLDEPLQRDVNVVLLLARDGVTADLAVLDR